MKSDYKSITFLVDNGNKAISYADRICNTHTTPKGKLGIVSLGKEELAQVYFKTAHRLEHFHLGGGG